MTSDGLYVAQLQLGPMKNFVYLVGPKDGRETFVVDPAWDVEALEQRLHEDGRVLSAAFLTHSHDDHVNGVPGLLARHDIPVYAQKAEVEFSPTLQSFGDAVKRLGPGESVQIGSLPITAIHTPGHTPGAQCLLCGGVLLSGDTLFINACGRCDFRGGDPHQMYDSLNRVLAPVPDETILLCGHDYADVPTASMRHVRATNPYFQVPDEAAFIALRMHPRS